MNIRQKISWVGIILIGIILVGFLVRVYRLDQIPPSLNWDEASAAYNAYLIAHYGRDETGKVLPLVFRSFLDDKHPVHIYLTALIVRIFGTSDFWVRFSAVLAGVGSIILLYFIAKIWFNKHVGLWAAFLLAISPYNIHFSRGLWETNFALVFFLAGFYFFFRGIRNKSWVLLISFLSFGISFISYHSAKVVVPVIVVILIALYIKELLRLGRKFYACVTIALICSSLFLIEPRLLGLSRAKQTQFSESEVRETRSYKITGSDFLGKSDLIYQNYFKHFSADYLFNKGDLNPRNGTKNQGQFYRLDLAFLIVGILVILYKRTRVGVVLLSWFMIAPLPSAMAQHAPQATRGLFMMGIWQLLVAVGIDYCLMLIRKKQIKIIMLVVLIAGYGIFFFRYIDYYFSNYRVNDAIEWQYGMKEIVEYVKSHPEYAQVYMTSERSQPYIFFLYYLKYPLNELLKTVEYNTLPSRSHNLVSFFDKYIFEYWDPIESKPSEGVLYVLTPSQYDGLRHKSEFMVKERVKYPSGADAFFLVSLD